VELKHEENHEVTEMVACFFYEKDEKEKEVVVDS
jgi:hypothetical protein